VWLLLLAYRVVARPAGQDPKYDAALAYWSGSFKVLGIIGLLAVALKVAAFIVDRL